MKTTWYVSMQDNDNSDPESEYIITKLLRGLD